MTVALPAGFDADLRVYVRPPDGRALRTASVGALQPDGVLLSGPSLAGLRQVIVDVGA